MKYFLLTFQTLDNGHEHLNYISTNARTEEEARAKGLEQEHEMAKRDDDQPKMFDFWGDGQTACHLIRVHQISKAHMMALDGLGVAHFYEL